ncbi:MAG: F0F1 ATP synthase subunit gamma [Propionibacteriaceae bacterium]|jgi:F-type H+-transporting ATPase subunit gamma|nr:F0F1 ATP synthase subunit gamma [Propionibacteriaceae bacterium]
MPATLRELRERRKSVSATMKITKAMELIAASRVMRAQARARRAVPYNEELIRAVSDVAAHTDELHPLTIEPAVCKRAAVLIISADRGLAGAYNANVIRTAEGLIKRLEEEDKELDVYTCGRKARDYLTFRDRQVADFWMDFSEKPTYKNAKQIGVRLIEEFLKPTGEGGVDELHVVFTRFKSMVSQQVQIVRLLPLEVVEEDSTALATHPTRMSDEYHYEPKAAVVLDKLLPLYIINRIHFALMESAASELAARQQAMHSATDNAKQLIDSLTRDANQARQAEITQEINEIVGGAGALSG